MADPQAALREIADRRNDEIISVLGIYLASPNSPSDTAEELASILERYLGSAQEDEWGLASVVYVHILRHATFVPHDDTTDHYALLDLLRALKSIPSTPRIDWAQLSPFGAIVREHWDIIRSQGEKEEWISVNAFIAKVVELKLYDFDVYPIWAMREALESKTSPDSTVMLDHPPDIPVHHANLSPVYEGQDVDLNNEVSVAAVWILYAGHVMWDYTQRCHSCVHYEGDRSAMGGARWRGSYGYSPERWKLWKIAFEEFSKSENVDDEARELAGRARRSMEKIETS